MTAHREPFEILESASTASVANILLCAEHSGIYVPSHLNGMGLSHAELNRHIGWDIGIDGTSRRLHQTTGLPIILGTMSRLVVDLNRPVHSDECIPEYSDGINIPANQNLTDEDRDSRLQSYYRPFHRALNNLILQHQAKLLLCLHSFTPQLRTIGKARPWHCGVLFDRNVSLGQYCVEYLKNIGEFVVGENQPYCVEHDNDRSIPLHGELKGIPTLLLEIRNDLIENHVGQKKWSSTIASLIHSLGDYLSKI